MKKIDYAYWKVLGWRFVRTALAAAITQALLEQPDLTDPFEAAKSVGVTFVTAFIVTIAKLLRDHFSEGDVTSPVQKVPL